MIGPARVVGNLHRAYRSACFKTARYGVLVVGPSATADIESALIFGAQGVRSLTVVGPAVMRRTTRDPQAVLRT